MRSCIDRRAMGADTLELGHLLETVEIEGEQARIGLAAARKIQAPPGTVGGDIVEAAIAADLDAAQHAIGSVAGGERRMDHQYQQGGRNGFVHGASPWKDGN